MTYKRYVPLQEYNCIVDQFSDHFQKIPLNNPSPIEVPELNFSVGSLQEELSNLECSGEGSIQGIVFHHGMKEDLSYDVAIQLVCLVPTGEPEFYSYDVPQHYYRCVGGALVNSGNISDWNSDSGNRYKENVAISRNPGDNWSAYDAGKNDVYSNVFVYQGGIEDLITQNNLSAESVLEVHMMTEPDRWTENSDGSISQYDFRHKVAVRAQGVTLTNTEHAGAPFKEKAADLAGTIPPYNSSNLRIMTTGINRRPGC